MSPDLVAIHPWTLLPDHVVGVDVMVWDDKSSTALKQFDAEKPITRSQFDQFARSGTLKFFIPKRSAGLYRDYLSQSVAENQHADRLPFLLRLTLQCESIRYKLQDALETESLTRWAQTAYQCASEFIQNAEGIHRTGKELPSLLRTDGGFTTHSFNTGLYAYILAKELRISQIDQEEALVAGFLHDTGKLGLDPDYPDQLKVPEGYLEFDSKAEQNSHGQNSHSQNSHGQKSHCTEGLIFLSKVPEITRGPLLASYQHHERIDGSGFPVGLPGGEIPLISKIVAVANRWDGLLCDRKGRQKSSRVVAWGTISTESKTYWDEEVARCLERMLNRPSQNY